MIFKPQATISLPPPSSSSDQTAAIGGKKRDLRFSFDADIVVDLQFGSTGKGLLAGYLARRHQVDATVTAWSPNAGHTFVTSGGEKHVHTMLANGIVSPSVSRVFIGPGSAINVADLETEIKARASYMFERKSTDISDGREYIDPVKLVIHKNAAIVTDEHRNEEAKFVRIGSTCKGSAESVIDKMRRNPGSANIAGVHLSDHSIFGGCLFDTPGWLDQLRRVGRLLIEGCQGYSLSLNLGHWPYLTSRDCTTTRTWADCGLPATTGVVNRWGVIRTLPIRVANRFGEDGGGSSGPCYPDQHELTWDSLGFIPEITTVTKRIRRVFTFSEQQLIEAIQMNGIDHLFVNFINYLSDVPRTVADIHGAPVEIPSRWQFLRRIHRIASEHCVKLALIGVGQRECDVFAPMEI